MVWSTDVPTDPESMLQESILQSLRSDRDVHQDRAGHPHLGRGGLPRRGLPSMLECKVRQPLELP